jgi:hypothetical protein
MIWQISGWRLVLQVTADVLVGFSEFSVSTAQIGS